MNRIKTIKSKVIRESYKSLWEQMDIKTRNYALKNNGWINSIELPDLSKVEPEDENLIMERTIENWNIFIRPKELEGIEDNYGWTTEPFVGEEGGMYLVIYKESSKKEFIKYTGRYIIKDGMIFDMQGIIPYVSHWRKLDFKEPLF